jgi:8-oxo-dGTP diphosphatase
MEAHPIPVVAVCVSQADRFLVGFRQGGHAAERWGIPGGKQGMWESPEEAGAREVFEETGLLITDLVPVTVVDCPHPDDDLHFVTMIFAARAAGEPELKEPAKCREWRWVTFGSVPEPQTDVLQGLLASGYRPRPER